MESCILPFRGSKRDRPKGSKISLRGGEDGIGRLALPLQAASFSRQADDAAGRGASWTWRPCINGNSTPSSGRAGKFTAGELRVYRRGGVGRSWASARATCSRGSTSGPRTAMRGAFFSQNLHASAVPPPSPIVKCALSQLTEGRRDLYRADVPLQNDRDAHSQPLAWRKEARLAGVSVIRRRLDAAVSRACGDRLAGSQGDLGVLSRGLSFRSRSPRIMARPGSPFAG